MTSHEGEVACAHWTSLTLAVTLRLLNLPKTKRMENEIFMVLKKREKIKVRQKYLPLCQDHNDLSFYVMC